MVLPFLTAYWKDLVVINYEVDPDILKGSLPRGTELDLFEGKAFISLVAFRFEKTRIFGLIPSTPIDSFEEINLRFYVKRNGKRAVAFIREIVPSRLIAAVARGLYQEPYVALPTGSNVTKTDLESKYSYFWGKDRECTIVTRTPNSFQELKPNSFEEFILEHYWGYTAQADAQTVEYQVNHPHWRFSPGVSTEISSAVADFYGPDFKEILYKKPTSVFVAEGSKVSVSTPKRFFHPLKDDPPKGWVLYDGLCGFCSWWIPYWRGSIRAAGYDVAPVQSDWVRQTLKIAPETLNSDIRLLLNDGSLINGADAYIYGMKQVWWSYPLGLTCGLPLFRQLTWMVYKAFNRNRFLVSKVCRLKPESM